jgi:hypothetical protein
MQARADETVRKRTRLSFTADEDDRLCLLVSKYGDDNWELIAATMATRDRRQCRERWLNYLSPAVCNGPWGPQEEALLRDKVAKMGRKWKSMEPFFPGRTDINLKNHWKQMQKLELEKCPPKLPPASNADGLFAMLAASPWQDELETVYQAGRSCQGEPLW